jgi:hypothetical protein
VSIQISFGGYRFTFQVLTTGNVYDVERIERVQEQDHVVFRAKELGYGEGSGSVAAFFEVAFQESPSGVRWEARAEHPEPIKGIKVLVESFPAGNLVIPPGVRTALPEGPGHCYVYPCGSHPIRERGGETGIVHPTGPLPGLAAQFVLVEGPRETICLRSNEYPPRFKRFWFYRVGDGLEVHLYSEENACERRGEYTAPAWHIERVPSWREAVDAYTAWMESAFGLVPFEQRSDTPEWLRRTALVAILHGVSSDGKICHNFAEMEGRLHELARLFPPECTLVKLLGFEGRVDYHLPDNLPGVELGGHGGFAHFMETAHTLGFKVLLHLNVWGMALDHPLYPQMREHQIYDSTGWPAQWDVDYDKDETLEATFAYISPDVPAFRQVLVECVRRLVGLYAPDALHMDQSAFPINDLRHNHMRGVGTLFKELKEAFPGVVFTGEGAAEWVAGMYPLSSGLGYVWGDAEVIDEMFLRTIGKYMRCYAHSGSLPPEPYRGVWTFPHVRMWWSEDRFRKQQALYKRLGVIPTLVLTDKRIRPDGDLAQMVLERARRWLAERD